jgi:hypothetical protein
MGLGCVTDEYETLMKEPVIQLLSRMIADRSISTRKELVFMCTNLLLKRISIFGRKAITDSLSLTYENHQKTVNKYGENNSTEIVSGNGVNTLTGELNDNSVSADIQLISLLLLLQGDDSEEVIAAAKQGLEEVAGVWSSAPSHDDSPEGMNIDITDAEMELQRPTEVVNSTATESLEEGKEEEDRVGAMISTYCYPVLRIITAGVQNWTSDLRLRNLKGLGVFINLIKGISLESLLPLLLLCLSSPIRYFYLFTYAILAGSYLLCGE